MCVVSKFTIKRRGADIDRVNATAHIVFRWGTITTIWITRIRGSRKVRKVSCPDLAQGCTAGVNYVILSIRRPHDVGSP